MFFFGQPAKLVFQVSITSFRVDLSKFPYAGAKVFSLDFSHSTGNRFKKGVVDEYVLRLKENRETNEAQTIVSSMKWDVKGGI